ncbi:hypothetical protein IE4872_PD01578 (plasmid) [Rhizobium gallicum]|uniref:Resolvase/invertase-type recombinase catalytic domain-containing protein n=1 Tax=Rhizobium gallicum TaxID=56730 RepID=A0A1L5NW66_9HYPH|nr:hypothetical protein IE4872_PD01578 [Rhizobium gallicum]
MFSLQVLGAVAQLERALIAERTKADLKAAKAGWPTCRQPRPSRTLPGGNPCRFSGSRTSLPERTDLVGADMTAHRTAAAQLGQCHANPQ